MPLWLLLQEKNKRKTAAQGKKGRMTKLKEENAALKARLARIQDALCPTSLGTDMDTWRAIMERQERHVFNEHQLIQRLGRSNGQAVRIVWLRYKDAVNALNGKEEGCQES
jgi:hypothetical protein